jgi:hypothetical protein
VTCPSCEFWESQYHRALAEVLEARLDVADGPRARVRELERNLARANTVTATLRRFVPRGRLRDAEDAIREELGVVGAAVYERTKT